ncbi:MAG: hypothetical protein EU539_03125 [Promethearchaeota archaeon]|nr:MAG: hypothetical protein EU539_03125 [Candidatus Lokiarchaeota archaeon]
MGKQNLPSWSSEMSEEIIEFTQPDIMLKLISTIDDRGWPHITLITFNRAKNPNQIVWGEFFKGSSKENVQKNPKQGILYMTPETPFKFIQVKAKFDHLKYEGEDLDYFNNSDFMRYFTYVNLYRVFYNDLIATTPIRDLPLGGIVKGILFDMIGKGGAKTKLEEKRLNPIGYNLFKVPIGVRAIAYVDPSDGYPIIIPCIQLQCADHNRLVFPPSVLKEDLKQIPVNSKVAVFGANFDMASQVVKGTFTGFHKFRLITFGVIEIEEIYNGSPPITGVIYPEVETRPKVTEFTLK